MKLTEYKERDIVGWHKPNVTEESIFYHKNKLIGAYFPTTNSNIRYLIDYIIDESNKKQKNHIPHVYGNRQLDSVFFGGLRTDGSLGRHKCTLSAIHKDAREIKLLSAISLLSYLGVEFASGKSEHIKDIYNNQKVQQKLLCDSNVCISDYFTSGSINFNGLLGLHYDTASLNGVFNLIFYKRKGNGGNLVLPELDLCIDSKSYSLAILNVKEVMHGVSAFEGEQRDSIVYYSVNGME